MNMNMNNNNINIFASAGRTSSFNQPPSSTASSRQPKIYHKSPNVQLVAPGSIFARRTDYKAFNALPKHKINSYHIKMEDDGSHGNDEVRWYILSNLSANKMSKACCIFCQKFMTIYDKYPLLEGAFFQSPIQHHELSAKVKTNFAPNANFNTNNSNSVANAVVSSSSVNAPITSTSLTGDNSRAANICPSSNSSSSQPNSNCQELHQTATPTNSNSSEEAHYRSTGSFSSSHSSGIGSSLGGSCSSGNGINFLTNRSDSASSNGSNSAINGRKSSASSSSVASSGFVSSGASPPMSASSVCINSQPSSNGTTTSSPTGTNISIVRHSSVGRRIGPQAQAFAEKVKQQQQQQQNGQSWPATHSNNGSNNQSAKSSGQDKYINAICMSCLEGWTYDIRCKFCHQPWIGSHFILGTMYNFDVFAAQPCCQARLSCNSCSQLVKMKLKSAPKRVSVASTISTSSVSSGENSKNVTSNANGNSNNGPGSSNEEINALLGFSHYSERYHCDNCDCIDNHFVKHISALYTLKEKEHRLSQSSSLSEKSNEQLIRP